jgi:hypothetical protein
MTLKGDFPDPEEVAALAMMALAAVALAGGLVVDAFWRLPLLRWRIPAAPAPQLPPRCVQIAWHCHTLCSWDFVRSPSFHRADIHGDATSQDGDYVYRLSLSSHVRCCPVYIDLRGTETRVLLACSM